MNASHCAPGEEIKLTELTCLGRGESVGLFAATIAPLVSVFAVSWLFCRIIANIVNCMRRNEKWQLVQYPIEVYLLSLFAGEFLEAGGDTLNYEWVVKGKLSSGKYCDAEAFVVTVGETAVALTTTVIAIHTFVLLWVGTALKSVPIAWIIVGLCWLFDILISLILFLTRPDFYTPSPYWCWLNTPFVYKLLVFYLWLWVAIFVSFLGYLPLYFWGKGLVGRSPGMPWWRFRFEKRKPVKHAFYLICYPLIYCTLGLPLSIVRWAEFLHHNPPRSLTLVTSFLFDLSGLCNVLLFVYTRKGLLLFHDGSPDNAEKKQNTSEEDHQLEEVKIPDAGEDSK